MITKVDYEIAIASGTLELIRGDEISRRIRAKYPFSAQIALLMDKDLKYDEWCDYQAFRSAVKAEVDQELAELARQIDHSA